MRLNLLGLNDEKLFCFLNWIYFSVRISCSNKNTDTKIGYRSRRRRRRHRGCYYVVVGVVVYAVEVVLVVESFMSF